jgi:hypothetical protein
LTDLDTLDVLSYGNFEIISSERVYKMDVLCHLRACSRLFVEQEMTEQLLPLIITAFEFGSQSIDIALLN